MTDEVRDISINVVATRAINSLNKMGQSLDALNGATGKTDAQLRQVDRQIAKAADTAITAAGTMKRLKIELREMSKALTQSNNKNTVMAARLSTANKKIAEQAEQIRVARGLVLALAKQNGALEASYGAVGRAATAAATQMTTVNKLQAAFNKAKPLQQNAAGQWNQGGVTPLSKPGTTPANPFGLGAPLALNALGTSAKAASKSVLDLDLGMENLARSVIDPSLRYALYDVSNSFMRLRDAGIAVLRGVITPGIEFEKNFANVARTSQIAGRGLDILRDQFLDLQTSMPITSQELARIGTLLAQMGVDAANLETVTSVVARFAATSGVSAEESATSLSRIGQLLDIPAEKYENLASAILKTGVNAIATEEQILRGTTQIASLGKTAGFTNKDIIALSSAMSSLGLRPELQRSVATSSFTRILTAVRGATEEAQKFGDVMGITGQQFRDAWNEDAYGTYTKLLETIAGSPNAIAILQDLRLASQRLTPNLLKMGQAFELFQETQADTTQGWNEATEVQRQYDIIAETTAAKVQIMQQAWEEFLIVIGADAVDLLGELAAVGRNVLKMLSDLAKNPVSGAFLNLLGIGTFLVTTVAALGVVVATAGAAFLGFRFVMTQLNLTLLKNTTVSQLVNNQLRALTASSNAAGLSFGRTATAASLLSKALGVITLLTTPLLFESQFSAWTRDVTGLGNSYTALEKSITAALSAQGSGGQLTGLTNALVYRFELADINSDTPIALVETARALGSVAGTDWGNLRLLDEELSSLATRNGPEAAIVLSRLRDQWFASGKTADQFRAAFTDTYAQMSLAPDVLNGVAASTDEYIATQEEAGEEELAHTLRLETMAAALSLVTDEYTSAEDALASFVSAFRSGAGDFFNFGEMLETAYGEGQGQGGGIRRFARDLETSLVDAGKWADGISQLAVRGAGALASEFAAQGPSSSAAIREALRLSDKDLSALEQNMQDAAFFASEAFAQAFASDNAILAEVYRSMLTVDPSQALSAVQSVRDAIASEGALSSQELEALAADYGFELEPIITLRPDLDPVLVQEQINIATTKITPMVVPVTSVGGRGTPITEQLHTWVVEEAGNTIEMNVDPNTEEGSWVLEQWRLSEYGEPANIQVYLDLTNAERTLNAFRGRANSVTVKVPTVNRAQGGPIPGYAGGTRAPLRGPGTSTSDSILARLSVGEWVHNAKAVRYYGPAMMDAINRMQFPKFATGGGVGFGPGNPSVGAGNHYSVNVVQNYPTTSDPIRDMKDGAEAAVAGIWR